MKRRLTLLACLLSLFAIKHTRASVTAASINSSDEFRYEVTGPGILTRNDSADLVTVLQGDSSAPGGNVELFASSESAAFLDVSESGAFATTPRVSLLGTLTSGRMITVSSLNGADWFTTTGGTYSTAYGADNLANTWFNDYVDALIDQGTPQVALGLADRMAAYDRFLTEGGFSRFSDPNISYMNESGDQVEIGFAGFFDGTAGAAAVLGVDLATAQSFFPNGVQFSEVALVNGQPFYSFSALNSGQVSDALGSHSGTYVGNFVIPEPSTTLLLCLTSSLLLRRRR